MEPLVPLASMAEQATTSAFHATLPAHSARARSIRSAQNAHQAAETTCICQAQPALQPVPQDGQHLLPLPIVFSVTPSVLLAKTLTLMTARAAHLPTSCTARSVEILIFAILTNTETPQRTSALVALRHARLVMDRLTLSAKAARPHTSTYLIATVVCLVNKKTKYFVIILLSIIYLQILLCFFFF